MKMVRRCALLLTLFAGTGPAIAHAADAPTQQPSRERPAVADRRGVPPHIRSGEIELPPPLQVRIIVSSPSRTQSSDGGRPFDLTFGFATESATLTAEGKRQLDRLANIIRVQDHPDQTYLIEGHADPRGPTFYNRQLSIQRAHAVKDYLVREHGFESKRILTHGWGETRPINPNKPASVENRGVEVSRIYPEPVPLSHSPNGTTTLHRPPAVEVEIVVPRQAKVKIARDHGAPQLRKLRPARRDTEPDHELKVIIDGCSRSRSRHVDLDDFGGSVRPAICVGRK